MIAPVVEGQWSHGVGAAPVTRRIPPDGCVDIIAIAAPDGRVTPYVYGPTERYEDVTLAAGVVIAGVRFRAGAGPRLLDVRGAELAGRSVALDELSPRAARMLRDAEPTRAGLRARLDDVAAMLTARAPAYREHDRAARAIAALAAAAAGADARARARAGRIAALARDLGTSERTLHRDFLAAVGLAPKVFARVARARHAAALLAAGATPIDAALAAGYADQAHLTRELVALHGVTPARVRNVQD